MCMPAARSTRCKKNALCWHDACAGLGSVRRDVRVGQRSGANRGGAGLYAGLVACRGRVVEVTTRPTAFASTKSFCCADGARAGAVKL